MSDVPGFAVTMPFCITSESLRASIGAKRMSEDVIIPTRRSSSSSTGNPLNLRPMRLFSERRNEMSSFAWKHTGLEINPLR